MEFIQRIAFSGLSLLHTIASIITQVVDWAGARLAKGEGEPANWVGWLLLVLPILLWVLVALLFLISGGLFVGLWLAIALQASTHSVTLSGNRISVSRREAVETLSGSQITPGRVAFGLRQFHYGLGKFFVAGAESSLEEDINTALIGTEAIPSSGATKSGTWSLS